MDNKVNNIKAIASLVGIFFYAVSILSSAFHPEAFPSVFNNFINYSIPVFAGVLILWIPRLNIKFLDLRIFLVMVIVPVLINDLLENPQGIFWGLLPTLWLSGFLIQEISETRSERLKILLSLATIATYFICINTPEIVQIPMIGPILLGEQRNHVGFNLIEVLPLIVSAAVLGDRDLRLLIVPILGSLVFVPNFFEGISLYQIILSLVLFFSTNYLPTTSRLDIIGKNSILFYLVGIMILSVVIDWNQLGLYKFGDISALLISSAIVLTFYFLRNLIIKLINL